MINEEIRKKLFELRDEKYRDFTAKLTPGENNIIGVKNPIIRNFAKEIAKEDYQEFFKNPYTLYQEERLLYGFVIGYLKTGLETVFKYLDGFLNYIDNWAVCDSTAMNLKIFKKPENQEKTYDFLVLKLNDKNPFVIRFVIVCLFCYFNNDIYCNNVAEIFQSIKSEHYYINMALAWGVSDILIKRYDLGIKILKNLKLDGWVHNKGIQKALESFRINEIKKQELRKLKV